MRPSSERIRRGAGGPAALWAQGISGDMPIVLVRIADIEDIAVASQLLRAHEYWRMKRLHVDLVILNERHPPIVQDLQIALETAGADEPVVSRLGRRAARLGVRSAHRSPFARSARPAASGGPGSLRATRRNSRTSSTASGSQRRCRAPREGAAPAGVATRRRSNRGLEFFNGLGGFAANGREYVTTWARDSRRRRRGSMSSPIRFRLSGRGRGQWLHLVCQQPRESADALVKRPGHGSAGRSDLSARRGYRRPVGAHGVADPGHALPISPARSRIQPVRARRAWLGTQSRCILRSAR